MRSGEFILVILVAKICGNMKLKVFFISLLVAFMAMWRAEGATKPIKKESVQEQEKAISEPIGWTYRTKTIGIDNTEYSFAELRSNNSIDLPFPYSGENHATIVIRKIKNGQLAVLLRVDKGQFIPHLYPDEYGIQLKADDGKTKYYLGYVPDGGVTGVLIFYDKKARDIIAAVKEAKIVKVSADFYKSDPKVFDFKAEGLDINKVDPDY